MTACSSILAWKIAWTEEPGRLLSVGSQRIGQDWAQHSNGEATESRAGKSGAKVWSPRASSSRTFRCPPLVL